MLDLVERSLAALARRRPLFHSEADLLLALGWELHTQEPAALVRLGQRLLRAPPIALDIFIRLETSRYGLELKYLKTGLSADVDGEHFDLAPDALEGGRYGVMQALARVERLLDTETIDGGCAVVLSNAEALWDGAELGLHEGGSIELRGHYPLHWVPYARVAAEPGGELRYLAIGVS